MAGKKPSFITGANARIKLGGKTFAYASDVAYQIGVDTIPIETMGRYEAVTNEPVNYSVGGRLNVVRYTKVASANLMPGTNSNGNGLGNVGFGQNSKGSDHIDPSKLLFSETFDIQVYQKQSGDNAAIGDAFISILDCRFTSKSSSLSKRGMLVDTLTFVGVLADDESFEVGGSGDTDLA